MVHRKFRVPVIARALVVLSFVLSAACDMHTSTRAAGKTTAGPPVRESDIPVVVITAHRLHPSESGMGSPAQARISQAPNPKPRWSWLL